MFNFREDLSKAVPVDAADLETYCPALSVAELLDEFAEWPDVAPELAADVGGLLRSAQRQGR